MLETNWIVLLLLLNPLSCATLNEDWKTEKMIENHDYPVEVHQVVTTDDFILDIHRIPAHNNSNKYPVLIQHGITTYSISYVFPPLNISLAYTLSDAGYDVWLGNIRGTPHSRHKTLTSDSEKYWNYTLEEISLYDLPAMIDYILNVTKQPKLYYIGHSMGTTLGFILLSTKSKYNDKIRLFIAEAPVAHLHHISSGLLTILIRLTLLLSDIARFFHIYAFPTNESINYYRYCSNLSSCILTPFIEDMNGMNLKEWNRDTFVRLHDNNIPCSSRVYQHFAQIYAAQKFRRFDWGITKNLIVYGQNEPTEFALEAIDTPTVFLCGLNDKLSRSEDVDLLTGRLSNHVETFVVEDEEWSHIDFLIAINVFYKVNLKILQMIELFD